MHADQSSAADAWKAYITVLTCIAELDCGGHKYASACPGPADLTVSVVSDCVWVCHAETLPCYARTK